MSLSLFRRNPLSLHLAKVGLISGSDTSSITRRSSLLHLEYPKGNQVGGINHEFINCISRKVSDNQHENIKADPFGKYADDLEKFVFPVIKEILDSHNVVLVMRGQRDNPECSHSQLGINLLKATGCDFHTVDISTDPALHAGFVHLSGSAVVPQLYVGGRFVGDLDAMRRLHSSGALERLVARK